LYCHRGAAVLVGYQCGKYRFSVSALLHELIAASL
jgi:hypothetical protein